MSLVKMFTGVTGKSTIGLCRSLGNSGRCFSAITNENQNKIKCTLIPGDGVGPELCKSVKQVFEALEAPIEFEEFYLSEVNPKGSAKYETVIASIRKNGIGLKGILTSPFGSTESTNDEQTMNMRMRKELDLYANVVHARSIEGIRTRHKNIDFITIREQTEGEYSAIEHESVPGVVECMKIITEVKSRRIAKFAFDYAVRNGRKKVTAVHKANIMKLSDGLFLKCCAEVSLLYPQIVFDSMIIDNTCMQLVSHPEQFDVLVMPNLYGNIVDNLASGLVGGAGVTPGASYSNECVIYEPGARHAFSEAVGKNICNPTAMLLSAAKMLRHLNLHTYADNIIGAIEKVMLDGKSFTRDLGGYASTTSFTTNVIMALKV